MKTIFTLFLALLLSPVLAQDDAKVAMLKSMKQEIRDEFEDISHLDASQIQHLLNDPKQKVILVDVRDEEEMQVSMIEGAINYEQFKQNEAQYKNYIVIPYCTIGYRSAKTTKKLKNAGFDARNFVGSIVDWTYSSGKLVHDGQQTHEVHTYGKKWDLVAPNYHGKY